MSTLNFDDIRVNIFQTDTRQDDLFYDYGTKHKAHSGQTLTFVFYHQNKRWTYQIDKKLWEANYSTNASMISRHIARKAVDELIVPELHHAILNLLSKEAIMGRLV